MACRSQKGKSPTTETHDWWDMLKGKYDFGMSYHFPQDLIRINLLENRVYLLQLNIAKITVCKKVVHIGANQSIAINEWIYRVIVRIQSCADVYKSNRRRNWHRSIAYVNTIEYGKMREGRVRMIILMSVEIHGRAIVKKPLYSVLADRVNKRLPFQQPAGRKKKGYYGQNQKKIPQKTRCSSPVKANS
jgi:hypothetical protein